jgi:hypothetical protein
MLPGALAALVLVGCSAPARTADQPPPAASAGFGNRSSPAPMPATPLAPSASLVPSAKVTRVATGSFQFSTPSKNIGCYVAADSARCDIAKKAWKPPAKPADCELDYGNGVAIFGLEEATVVCAADTVLGGAKTLAYGEVVRVGSFLCDSESSGVRCTNEDSRDGFALSRKAYTMF